MATLTGRHAGAAWAGCALLLAACAAGASIAPSVSPSFDLPPEPAEKAIVVDGEALTVLEDPATDPAVGEPLPALSGTSTRGEPMDIGPGDGPMAIMVVAHWCPHCQAEVALLSDHLRVNGMPEDIRVVAVSTAIDETRGNFPSTRWLANAEWPVETIIDDADGSALQALGVPAFPALVLVDGEGNVALRVTGSLDGPTFDQALDTLRGG